MAEYLIQDTTLTDIAAQIRVLSGTEKTMTPAEMATDLKAFNTDMNTVVTEQDSIIAQIITALDGKVAGSGGDYLNANTELF